MAAAILLPPDTRPRPSLPVRQFTLAEYHRLIEIGMLKPSDRVELISGWIVPKMPQIPPHARTVTNLNKWFFAKCGDYEVRSQGPITLTDDSEPEPDVAIAQGPGTRYGSRHPGPGDVLLVVEVSDSSLAQDRGEKLEVYARDGIPQYWVVNLVDSQIEVHTLPRAAGRPTYQNRVLYVRGESIPVTFGRKAVGKVKVDDILP